MPLNPRSYRGVSVAARNSQVSVTVPSVATGADTTVSVTVSGAQLGDYVSFAPLTALPTGVVVSATVTAADTVTFSVHNGNASTFNPGAVTYNIRLDRPKLD